MAITNHDIDRLARLARLDPSPAERDRLGTQLSAFFRVVEQMRAVDTAGVEPMAHPSDAVHEAALRLRDDIAAAPLDAAGRSAYQQNAPAVERGLFLVPKVIE